MQVFLPYPDLKLSVSCLDPMRLGNQVYREGLTLIRGGWPRHLAAKIWANHKRALAQYCLYGLEELRKRGRNYPHHWDFFQQIFLNSPDTGNPKCVGIEEFHASHRSNLLRKNFQWYSKFGWTEPIDLPYVWIY